jgi:site-specific recombinase XerD
LYRGGSRALQQRESDMDIILDIKNNLKNHNHRLRKIGKLVGISEHLTSYVARHSWASIANFSGVHIGVISQGLGHNDIKTTQTYLANFDYSDIDEANASIL